MKGSQKIQQILGGAQVLLFSPAIAFFDGGDDHVYPDFAGVVPVEETEDRGRELGRGEDFVQFAPANS